jgi:hypothetical protein
VTAGEVSARRFQWPTDVRTYILEEAFELMLVNARHVKNVPGRTTDVSDAQWLCQLMGAVEALGHHVTLEPAAAA